MTWFPLQSYTPLPHPRLPKHSPRKGERPYHPPIHNSQERTYTAGGEHQKWLAPIRPYTYWSFGIASGVNASTHN